MSGVDVAKQLKAARAVVRVLALSAYDDGQYVRNLLANGAAGYITKEEAPEMIIEAVRGVARGEEGWLSRRAMARMSAWTRDSELAGNELSSRELEVLRLVVAGKTNQEIGHTCRSAKRRSKSMSAPSSTSSTSLHVSKPQSKRCSVDWYR